MTTETKKTATEKKMSYQAFVENAIRKLRNEKSKGIHVVFSKLNAYMKAYYGEAIDKETASVVIGEETRQLKGAPAVIRQLIAAGKIDSRPAKGGLMVFIKGEMSQRSTEVNVADMNAKLGLK